MTGEGREPGASVARSSSGPIKKGRRSFRWRRPSTKKGGDQRPATVSLVSLTPCAVSCATLSAFAGAGADFWTSTVLGTGIDGGVVIGTFLPLATCFRRWYSARTLLP